MPKSTSRRFVRGALLAAGVVALAIFGPASAQDQSKDGESGAVLNITASGNHVRAAGAQVTVSGTAESLQVAGATVTVRGAIVRDAMIAGAQVSFAGNVGEDLKVAGASLDLRGQVGDDLQAAGAVLVTNTTVKGDAMLGGATVTVGPASDIGGTLHIGGAAVTISGHVTGKVEAAGGLVTINARTDGDVEVRGAQVMVGPTAQIAGDLIVYSLRDPVVAEGAVITGTVQRFQPPDMTFGAPAWVWQIGFAIYIALGTIVAGVVLLLFGGHVFATATHHVRHRPLSSFLFGILTAVLVPFVAIVLMATVIGLSAGFAVLFLLPFLFIFGHSVAAAGIAGGLFIRRPGELGVFLDLVMLILGAVILLLISLIPWVGPALVGIAIILGLGAFTRTVGARIRRPAVAAAPVV